MLLSGMLICDEIKLLFSYFWTHSHIQAPFMTRSLTSTNSLSLEKVKQPYFIFCTKTQQESKRHLIKLFWLLFSISNTQTRGFYYTFIRDNDFTALREPYVSAVSRKILSTGRLTAEVSWRCFLTLAAHINVANSDRSNKMRFLAFYSLMVINFNRLFFPSFSSKSVPTGGQIKQGLQEFCSL